MRTIRLDAITRRMDRAYAVRLSSNDGALVEFVLEVDEGDILLVRWAADFAEYMAHNMSPFVPSWRRSWPSTAPR